MTITNTSQPQSNHGFAHRTRRTSGITGFSPDHIMCAGVFVAACSIFVAIGQISGVL